jgi:hypothetical protein
VPNESRCNQLTKTRTSSLDANASINSLVLCGCKFGTVGYVNRKDASLRVQRYAVSNEFRNFKTVCGGRVGASVCEYGTSLRECLVCVRTDGAFNESIEGFWPGRLRSRGSCLYSHRQ